MSEENPEQIPIPVAIFYKGVDNVQSPNTVLDLAAARAVLSTSGSIPSVVRGIDGVLSVNDVAAVILAMNWQSFRAQVPQEEHAALRAALDAIQIRLATLTKHPQHTRSLYLYCAQACNNGRGI